MGGTPPYGYDLAYYSGSGDFICIVRFMPDGSRKVLNEDGDLVIVGDFDPTLGDPVLDEPDRVIYRYHQDSVGNEAGTIVDKQPPIATIQVRRIITWRRHSEL